MFFDVAVDIANVSGVASVGTAFMDFALCCRFTLVFVVRYRVVVSPLVSLSYGSRPV